MRNSDNPSGIWKYVRCFWFILTWEHKANINRLIISENDLQQGQILSLWRSWYYWLGKKKKKKKDRHKNCYPIFTILTFRKILRDFSAELLTCCWLAIMWGVQIQEWKGNCRRQKCLPNMGENIFNSRTLLVLQSSQRRETFLMFWS